MNSPTACCILVAVMLLSIEARAERADRDKPITVESDRMTADDANKVLTFEGRVVVTQGTMTIRSDRVTLREDKDGTKSATAIGKPARFRQKRDNVNEWIDGEAERIEYDGRAERVELFVRARLSREKDEVRGNYIAYDQKTEFFRVQHAKDGATPSGETGRIQAVLQPRSKTPPREGAAPGLELKSIEVLPNTR
jgi:lipopolysaccharide export system protein LptA